MDDYKLNVISPFGPKIVKVEIPEKILKILNDHVDKVTNDEKLHKELDYGKNE
jgi:hypothetical protein